jgi:hypothetical protein
MNILGRLDGMVAGRRVQGKFDLNMIALYDSDGQFEIPIDVEPSLMQRRCSTR